MSTVRKDLHYDRFWLLTWTTYGTRLPGDPRGTIGVLHSQVGTQIDRNRPGDPEIESSAALQRYGASIMKGDPVFLNQEQARVLLTQFHCTSGYRQWRLLAVAIMKNHIHLGVNVHGDPEPESIMRDFKSYGSRALNLQWGKPKSETWWTESGSSRKLDSESSVLGSVRYMRDQEFPLVIWTIEDGMVYPIVEN